jgi:hypothetical protein
MTYTTNNSTINAIASIANSLGIAETAVRAELNVLHELISSADRGCGYGVFNGLTLEQTIEALYEVTVLPRTIAGDRKFYPLGNGEEGVKLALIFKSLIWDEGNLTHPSIAEIAAALGA